MAVTIKLVQFGQPTEEITVQRFRELLRRVAQSQEAFDKTWEMAMRGGCIVNLHRYGAAVIAQEQE